MTGPPAHGSEPGRTARQRRAVAAIAGLVATSAAATTTLAAQALSKPDAPSEVIFAPTAAATAATDATFSSAISEAKEPPANR